ncbi:MAG TPA: hypothetical protein VKB38_18500 [Terracidiphilus sp.]|nr:hypothetical protein [Terracidiphilus sp.]
MKRKGLGKNEKRKRSNQTGHQRAITDPKVVDALNALRGSWSDLSPQQRGEQLSALIDRKCSVRGLAKELGKPESSLRRYMAEANSTESDGGWATMMRRTLAKGPVAPNAPGAPKNSGNRISEILQAKKGTKAVVKDKPNVEDRVHLPTTPQTKNRVSPPSATAQGQPIENSGLGGTQSQAGNGGPRISLVDQYRFSRGQGISDKMQRLAEVADSIQPRPFRNARSLKRQGKPSPPTD